MSKMMEEIKNNKNYLNKNNKEDIYNTNFNIKMKQEKILTILENSGIIEAYKILMNNLHTNGLPEENIYEYSSNFIKNYEKQWKEKKAKIKNDNIKKYYEDKKQNYLKNLNDKNNKNNNSLIYRLLKEREGNQFIKKLDRSRSSLHILKKNITIVKGNESELMSEKDKSKNINVIKLRNNIKKKNKFKVFLNKKWAHVQVQMIKNKKI